MTDILGFAACAVVIFFAGKKLSFYGDLIAEKTGLGKAWIGLILMASVTSLPELMVGISSSAIVASADLAVGDILGSCTFNLAILAMLDLFVPKHQHLFFIASSARHILSAALGMILITLAGLGLFLPGQIVLLPGIGIMSVAFISIYLLSIRIIYRFDTLAKVNETRVEGVHKELPPLKKIIAYYTLFALITIGAALFIPHFADRIATQTGLGNSFVGTVLVAASTSLPEIAVSIAAVRFGSVDLAIGNVLGSNIFNILVLALDDLAYTKGVLLKDASDVHIVSAFSCIIMTAIAIAGFTYRAPRKRFLMAIDALLILAIYFLNMILLFVLTRE
jgi:cation:H+ antiporter